MQYCTLLGNKKDQESSLHLAFLSPSLPLFFPRTWRCSSIRFTSVTVADVHTLYIYILNLAKQWTWNTVHKQIALQCGQTALRNPRTTNTVLEAKESQPVSCACIGSYNQITVLIRKILNVLKQRYIILKLKVLLSSLKTNSLGCDSFIYLNIDLLPYNFQWHLVFVCSSEKAYP